MEGSGSTQLSINRMSMRDINGDNGIDRDKMLSRDVRNFKHSADLAEQKSDNNSHQRYTSEGDYSNNAKMMFRENANILMENWDSWGGKHSSSKNNIFESDFDNINDNNNEEKFGR